jgi:dienelactone hydrolase
MRYIYVLAFVLISKVVIAQKSLVNDTSYLNWTTLKDGNISANGDYVYYRIENEPQAGNTWVITATDKSWEYRSTQFTSLNFSPNGKYLYAMQGDSLVKLKLKSKELTGVPNCKGYELYSFGKKNWIIYSLNDTANTLTIQDLNTGLIKTLSHAEEYSINKNGGAIVSKKITPAIGRETMKWTYLNSGQSLIIYEGTQSKNIIYDLSGNRVAFDTTNEKGQTEIRYYQRGWKMAKLIATDTSEGINRDLKITTDELFKFGEDGQDLFFYLKAKAPPVIKKSDGPAIWNYRDLYLLSEYRHREGNLHRGENFSKLKVNTGEIKQLLFNNQKVAFESADKKKMDVVIVESSAGKWDELTWNKSSHLSYYLCYTKTGKIVPIRENCRTWIYVMELSPNSEFLVYYDPEISQYISYSIKNNKRQSISTSLNNELNLILYSVRPNPDVQQGTNGIVGWIKDSNKLIVLGKYDLWELDLENKNVPKNLTNGYGEANNLVFAKFKNRFLDPGLPWLLNSFNNGTKNTEIYFFNYKSRKLTLIFETATLAANMPTDVMEILKKATKVNKYLIRLGNSQNSPNYVYTSDFKKLDTLSDNFPEKKYNWLTSELAIYKDQEGRDYQGRLYKPENFDSKKKYPVIFYYYIESANTLNQPLTLEPSGIGLNIPLLISNGYIICMPNIYLEANKPGDGALKSVLAAADYLKKFSWVDSTKMGIIGHSRGGYETDYIITHTNRFSAAVSCSGMSNLPEYYNTLAAGGEVNHNYVRTQMLMTSGMEEIPDAYNKNSPILESKNISTPLLLMHNEEDPTVRVSQSKELFVQLRSIEKPVWLLQYEGEGHALYKENNQIDFQNKVKDFFDHYLKDKPMPHWMDDPIK